MTTRTMRPRQLGRSLRLSLIPVTALLLASCGLFGRDEEQPPPPPPAVEQPPEVESVRAAVAEIVEPEGHPQSAEVFDVLIEAGYEPDQLEATLDASPLENEVPSKVFAVRTDDGCIIGEIRGGQVQVAMNRAVESLDICLFGDVDRPEGVEPPEGDPNESGAGAAEGDLPDEGGSGSGDSDSGGSDDSDSGGGSGGLGGN